MKLKFRVAAAIFIAVAILSFLSLTQFRSTQLASTVSLVPDLYSQHVQPILNSRCVACHGCYSSPCQLNLQSYEGLTRGARPEPAFNPTRLKSVAPTRLDIDAKTTEEWRKKGFYDLLGVSPSRDEFNSDHSIFLKMLDLKSANKDLIPKIPVVSSSSCPLTIDAMNTFAEQRPDSGMPYGLPPLTAQETAQIKEWIFSGALSPTRSLSPLSSQTVKEKKEWEDFFNQPDNEHRLTTRYLYEHLFLAHLYFDNEPQSSFRIVRSRTSCDQIEEIATTRPNGDPKINGTFWYCLKRNTHTIVEKANIPYTLSKAKLKRINEIFFSQPWSAGELPGYDDNKSSNPFLTFREIPAQARYRFLIEDARYHVSTFIKGPVCNGNSAVNSIQEQFYVFFLNPEADPFVQKPTFTDITAPLLKMPGQWGSDVVARIPQALIEMTKRRNQYRRERAKIIHDLRPKGLTLDDLWNGDNKNPNAVLTVLRHADSSFVKTGAIGDLSKTVFVLDYAIFERLVYDLVVDFDTFGDIGHMLMTREYMAFLRMEAEELFLQFLPADSRNKLRDSWYQGSATQIKMSLLFPPTEKGLALESGISFQNPTAPKQELINRILFEHLNSTVRGKIDSINWKLTKPPSELVSRLSENEQALRQLTLHTAAETPFVLRLPDFSVLIIRGEDRHAKGLYSIVRNKEMMNLAWINGEGMRRKPQDDNLIISSDWLGSYPNLMYSIYEKDVPRFTAELKTVRTARDWNSFVSRWGVLRSNPDFWTHYDDLVKLVKRIEPIESGVIDLSRYGLF